MPQQVQISIRDLRLASQFAEFDVVTEPAATGAGHIDFVVVDAEGGEQIRERIDVEITDGAARGVARLVEGDRLGNGDHVVWVRATIHTNDDVEWAESEFQGVSCIVHTGHVYPSSEAPPAIPDSDAIELGNARMEGDWIIADVTNRGRGDAEVAHRIFIGHDSAPHGVMDERGEERVRAGATQQIHYMCPRDLPDGENVVTIEAWVAGDISGDIAAVAGFRIEAYQGTVTVVR